MQEAKQDQYTKAGLWTTIAGVIVAMTLGVPSLLFTAIQTFGKSAVNKAIVANVSFASKPLTWLTNHLAAFFIYVLLLALVVAVVYIARLHKQINAKLPTRDSNLHLAGWDDPIPYIPFHNLHWRINDYMVQELPVCSQCQRTVKQRHQYLLNGSTDLVWDCPNGHVHEIWNLRQGDPQEEVADIATAEYRKKGSNIIVRPFGHYM